MNINTFVNFIFPLGKNLVYNGFVIDRDKYMKKIQMTIITVLIFVMMCSASWAATYYIDGTNGNDTNSGSRSAPWKTIGKANNTLIAGDTVYIKKGTYKQTIRPSRSGEEGRYITYAQNGNDEVIITGVSDGANLVDRSYIVIDGFKILDVRDNWVDLRPNGCHNIIKNCHMEEAGAYTGILIRDYAHYNKILNNTLIGKCGPSDLIQVWNSGHNLIEGNSLYGGPHDAMDMQDRDNGTSNYNILRNNYIQNRWHSNLNINALEYILLENNVVVDGGEDRKDNACGSERDRTMAREEHKGIQLMSQYSIVRNNILVNNGYGICLSSGSDSTKYPWKSDSKYNRIYHNTINRNYEGIRVDGDPASINNVLMNNIIFNNVNHEIRKYGSTLLQNLYVNNNVLGAKVTYGSNDIVKGNLSVNPLFVNETGREFKLQSNSRMINAGAFLTKTISPGDGKIIEVEDARYFMDGWGIINGDMIQLEGQNQTARITRVDYRNNTIAVDTSLVWTKGQGVSLPYQGSAPDIGALEFGKEASNCQSPKNLRVVYIDYN